MDSLNYILEQDIVHSEKVLLLFQPVRLATEQDIPNILELWANSACLKQIHDPIRWSCRNNATQIWHQHAKELIHDPSKILLICDLQDNGLSGFLSARMDERPSYYEAKYSLDIEEFYLRPKDRSGKIFDLMLETLQKEVQLRCKLNSKQKISLKIEALESEAYLIKMLKEKNVNRCSVTYTINI